MQWACYKKASVYGSRVGWTLAQDTYIILCVCLCVHVGMCVYMSCVCVLACACSGKVDDELSAEVNSLMSNERLLYWSKVFVLYWPLPYCDWKL